MNSKLVLCFIIAVASVGCGVKARPQRPPEKAINSYIESYTGTPYKDKSPKKEKKK